MKTKNSNETLNDNERRFFLSGLFFWILTFLTTRSFEKANISISVSNKLEGINEQLADNTQRLNNLPYFDVKRIKDTYFPNDTDYTNAFIKAVSLAWAQTNYLYARILFPRNSATYTFNNGSPIVLKNNIELLFEEGAEIQYTGVGNSLFTNDPTTASLFLLITGKGKMIVNNKTLFNFRYSKLQPFGFNVKCRNMNFVGSDATRTGNAFSLGWTDFCHFENCDFYNLNKAIEIVSYHSENRGNTQIKLDVISMVNVNTGVEFDQLDKATFQNVDIAQCRVGFLGHTKNLLVKFINCHVEGYDNYAYQYDGDSNVNNSYDSCSCFNPSSSAIGGFYSPQLDWNANGQNHFSFNNCDFVKASQLTQMQNYVPFYCPSPFEWRGVDFEYQNAQNVNNSDYPVGGAKIYTILNRATSKNLLGITNLNDTSLLSSYSGTVTITADSTYYNGVHINWVAASHGNILQIPTKQALNVGWHTLIIEGSQLNFNNFNVGIQNPDFSFLLNQSMIELTWKYRDKIVPARSGLKTQTLTIPFYVSTAGAHYVTFYANAATSYDILLGGIYLVSGFATDYHAVDRVWNKSSVPTSGYWYKDDIVYNSSAAASGDKIGWKCMDSGSPGIWMSLGTLGTP